jgi:hypothetical protein
MTDIFHAGRSPEFVIDVSGRMNAFDEVNREACDLAVIDKSSKCLVITAPLRAYKRFELG